MKVFNVGDKARVRKDLVGGRIYDTCTSCCCYCTETMTNYAGSVVVVSEKDDMTGNMYLRKVEDGFTTEMPFSWSDDMLEPLEEEQPQDDKSEKGFKVGDKVVIKATVSSGKRYDGIFILRAMLDSAYEKIDTSHQRRRIGTVSYVCKDGDIKINFGCNEKNENKYIWPQSAFELYDVDNDKPKLPKKQQQKKKSAASTADYSGYTPKSEFYCYDYLNRKRPIKKYNLLNVLKNITKIEVTVMSGDETGCFYGVYNGKPWQYKFDAAESRFASYDDGSYTVEGRENIEKWINWSYDQEKAIYKEYSMERMRAFKRC